MIKTLGVEGYRAFDRSTELPLRSLTLIFGKNNSGKTTLTRLPLFIAASLDSAEFFSLTWGDLRLGSGFRDLANGAKPHPAVSYWVELEGGEFWRTNLQLVSRELSEVVHVVELNVGGSVHTQAIDAPPNLLDSLEQEDASTVLASRENIAAGFRSMVHIESSRPDIQPVYEIRAPADLSVCEAPYFLLEHPDLLEAVSSWFEVWFEGLRVEVERNDYAFRVIAPAGSARVNLSSAGRGLQALFPIVVLMKAITMGIASSSLVVIEEPETHLHPSAHVAIAELIAEASQHTQIITETHSENLILRLRRKIATSELSPGSLQLLFIDDTKNVLPIVVAGDGSVSDWPDGVFAYDVEEARAIVEARLLSIGAV